MWYGNKKSCGQSSACFKKTALLREQSEFNGDWNGNRTIYMVCSSKLQGLYKQ